MTAPAKWTPGPWVQDGHNVFGPVDARSKHRNGRTLVGGVVDTLTDWRAAPSESPEDRASFDAEARANARLIAAAPALAEALGWMVTSFEDLLNEWPTDELHEPPSVTLDRARAALRLARGEE